MAVDQKQFNEVTARLARLETLLQDNDVFKAPDSVSLDDFNFGPSMDFTVPDYTDFFNNQNLQWDAPFDPSEFWDNTMQYLDDTSGTDGIVDEMLARLANIENFLGGPINDTNQSDALDWGADVGDDGMNGTGEANGVPDGYAPVEIAICDGTTAKIMNVLGTTPV